MMEMTQAEDRAPVGTDPSADLGVASEDRAVELPTAHLPRLQHQAINPGVWGRAPANR